MILPTLPRFLSPKDKILIPVTVFGMENNIGDVDVSIETKGAVKILGKNKKSIVFKRKDDKDVEFLLEADNAIGIAHIILKAKSKNFETKKDIEIGVISPKEYTYTSENKIINPGEKVKFIVKNDGIYGSNESVLKFSKKVSTNFNHRLNFLIKYPYGCVEQTVSSIFPQLFLPNITEISTSQLKTIDNNINAGIERLRTFQTSGGGLSYWPYERNVCVWGSNYAFHFLVEAKRKGYHVPSDLYERLLDYEENMSRKGNGSLLERCYREYVLSMVSSAGIGSMNILKENHISSMSNTEKWLLAASYYNMNINDVAYEIMKSTGIDVEAFDDYSATFGSQIRDKAIVLDILTRFEDKYKALTLYREISGSLAGSRDMSTQTAAYALIAISNYLESFTSNQDMLLVVNRNNNKEYVQTDKVSYDYVVSESSSKEIEIQNNSGYKIFASQEWCGIYGDDNTKTISKNISMEVKWLDSDGNPLDITTLKQGNIVWGQIRVKKNVSRDISEVALCQKLPSGWELGNYRLSGETLPDWTKNLNLNREEYLDIRDDKIMWFFDMNKSDHYDFIMKINVVTKGEFILPPTICEAMYNSNYIAIEESKKVKVE